MEVDGRAGPGPFPARATRSLEALLWKRWKMRKFKKMVAIEPTKLLPEWDERLKELADDAVFHEDIPESPAVIAERIGDADCVILSYTTQIGAEVLDACPGIRYIGMCCSLYSPQSANVDILRANDLGIVVKGARDYGDIGVKEYVIHALVARLQGRGAPMWKADPMELTGVKVGVIGLGTLGTLVAETLRFFDTDVHYYSRTRKLDVEERLSCTYRPLNELLDDVEIVITCLTKNVVLFDDDAFARFGPGKIFMNVSIAPGHDVAALRRWLSLPGTFAMSDSVNGIGAEVADLPNVIAGERNAGLTYLAKHRLGGIVVDNAKEFLSR